MAAFRRICCPVDFSEPSRFAMELAADLARREGAGLTLLHVTLSRWPGDQGTILPDLGRESREVETLARWTADAEVLRGSTVDSTLLSSPAGESILAFARATGVDLIVMASHGRAGLSRLLLGSVAEAVLRRAPCPVLVVRRDEPSRPPDAEDGMPA